MGKPSLIPAHLGPSVDSMAPLYTAEPRVTAIVVCCDSSPVLRGMTSH
jgi:hypothetical protein